MTETATVPCACCLRDIVLGKATSPKRHGWKVQGNRTVGSYGQSWHTGPCVGVDFPNLRESPAGAQHMIAKLRRIREDRERTFDRIERRSTPLTFGVEVGSQLFNSGIIRSPKDQREAKESGLLRLVTEWGAMLCPVDVDILSIIAVPRRHRSDAYHMTVSVAPGWAGSPDGYVRLGERYSSFYFRTPSYEQLRTTKLEELRAEMVALDAEIDRFHAALRTHGWA